MPKKPPPTSCQTASQRTIKRTVTETAWNVFSRRSAIAEPTLPQTSAPKRITRAERSICGYDIPPKRARITRRGTEIKTKVITSRRLARSFPRTSSLLVIRVSRSRTSVRRSFSRETPPAARSAAKKRVIISCKGTISRKRAVPNREKSPVSEISCAPVITSHAVAVRRRKSPPQTALPTKVRARRGEMVTSRVKTGPMNIASKDSFQSGPYARSRSSKRVSERTSAATAKRNE